MPCSSPPRISASRAGHRPGRYSDAVRRDSVMSLAYAEVARLLPLLLLTACRGSSTPAEFDVEGDLAGPGAPDRAACTSDADCMITDVPSNRPLAPPPRLLGCCATGRFVPVTRAFQVWMTAFQSRHCPADRSHCPELPAPAMPAQCVHEARCLGGTCGNACGAAPP